MSRTPFKTFADAEDHLLAYLGGQTDSFNSARVREAVQAAYRRVPDEYEWTYFVKRENMAVVAAYSTGTFAYDHTGGSNEREVTLTSGTWPSWAARGMFRYSNIDYRVQTRVSDSVIVLATNSNPGADVAAGATYSLAQDAYAMPLDFGSNLRILDLANLEFLEYVSPAEWLDLHRTQESSNDPRWFTWMQDPDYYNSLALFLYPAPVSARTYDLIYRRKALALKTARYSTGTVSVSSTTVTGVGTSWGAQHVGSVIRFGDSTNVPSGDNGPYPYKEERVITAVGSTTSLTIDSTLTNSYAAGTKYVISDMVDLEYGAMYDAFLAYAEYRAECLARGSKSDREGKLMEYNQQLEIAMAADTRQSMRENWAYQGQYAHLRDEGRVTIDE